MIPTLLESNRETGTEAGDAGQLPSREELVHNTAAASGQAVKRQLVRVAGHKVVRHIKTGK